MKVRSADDYSPLITQEKALGTLLPPESPFFDETVENYVRFVQGANAFITLFELYEIVKLTYLYTMQHSTCRSSSSLITSLTALNLLWIFIALIGIASINSRQTYKVNRFLHLLSFNGVLRVVFYFVCFNQMNNISSNGKFYCGAIYRTDVFLIQTFLEALVSVILFFLTKCIKNYLQGWDELSEPQDIQESEEFEFVD